MKKILMLDPKLTGEWASDLFFAGLVKRFGQENVLDYPMHMKYRKLPVRTGNDHLDWDAQRGMAGFIPDCKVASPSRPQLIQMMQRGEIGAIFVEEHARCHELYKEVSAGFFNIPVIVATASDDFDTPLATLKQWYGKNLRAIFTQNWLPEFDGNPLVHVFNYSVNFDYMWDVSKRESLLKDKIYDISFSGNGVGIPERPRFVEHIRRKWGHLKLNLNCAMERGYFGQFRDEYFETMARSKICLNLPGASRSRHTLRFYEIPYVGSCMLSYDAGFKQLFPLLDGTHCMYFKDENELDMSIEFLLNYPEYRERYAKQGHDFVMKNYDPANLVKRMFDDAGLVL
ncbi:MAG: glycosyltransferase family protein [Acidiferrobacterales bacterium]